MFIKNILITLRRGMVQQKKIWGLLPYSSFLSICDKSEYIRPYNYTIRTKYTQNTGVKGIRNRKAMHENKTDTLNNDETEEFQKMDALNLDDREYDQVVSTTMNVFRDTNASQNILVLQPYIKWGPKRDNTTPDDRLQEAEALVRSLPNWQIAHSIKVPLESMDRKKLFGSGKMTELKQIIQNLRESSLMQKPITCIFVSKGSLTFVQKRFLEDEFKLPVMDRYSVVIQILRLHAVSAEARIQVAMAEIPYIWNQAKDSNLSTSRKQGYTLTDIQRDIIKTREKKLKQELERIRSHRKLLRNKRQQKNYPIVAVVGYTNSGKTSLIKALTYEQTMQPKDQLFATLDVTAHAGILPCNLKVIYMDTVGFMSDLPTGLIECFIATLEDAMLADVIVHVQDVSHDCHEYQRQHVESTLQTLTNSLQFTKGIAQHMPTIINVGNKIDLINKSSEELNIKHLVSAKKQTGLNALLLDIEENILKVTHRSKIKMRVRNGGNEMKWLYKNAAIVDIAADNKNAEMLLMEVVISQSAIEIFKKIFC